MATKVFEKAEMHSEDAQIDVLSCKFGAMVDSAFVPGEIYDGAFVNLGGLAEDEVYSTNSRSVKDWNVRYAFAPATGKLGREDIFVIDIANIQENVIAGNTYRGISSLVVNLTRPAGAAVRCRRMHKGDLFWLGSGNFVAAPTIGQFGNVSNGSTYLTAGSSATADQFAVEVIDSKPLTIGTTVAMIGNAYEELYLCEVQ